MRTDPESLLLCACCPSPCRRAIASEGQAQTETLTPSAMAMIAVAVDQGQIDFDDDVRRVFANTDAIRPCVAVCTYALDIAGVIDRFVASRGVHDVS